ncbi:hypothetical protein IID62_04190 [candidate division KSB1 bacterium]|nr:hypothetical protein [candidate division KSB1 bacterium]
MTDIGKVKVYSKTGKWSGFRRFSLNFTLTFCGLALLFGSTAFSQVVPDISPVKFSEMVNSMSESGGYFRSDNWVTNEWTYLDIIEPMKKLEIEGGVYIGVASNQNFTYIANIKPDLVFFVDIRHQNKMQHLVYKILFELADTRAEWISLLFAKPLDKDGPGKSSDINEIVAYFRSAESDRNMYEENKQKIVDILTKKYKFELDDRDLREINNVLNTFYMYNLNITYSGGWSRRHPTLGQLMQLSVGGEQKNAFNSRDDYLFLKKLQEDNKIIPLTGDFAGPKALTAVADYLNDHKLTVSAYYVSNVEQYLFRNWVFPQWANNIKKLPLTDKSIFIRWSASGYRATRLQYMKNFVKNFDAGKYYSYEELNYYDYIIIK